MSATLEVLKRARELIKIGWTQRVYNRNVMGVECFCAEGAIYKALSEKNAATGESEACQNAFRLITRNLPRHFQHDGRSSIINFNDDLETDQASVLAVFDAAIASAESDGKEGQQPNG